MRLHLPLRRWRLMAGWVNGTPAPTNYWTARLYNDSNVGEIIRVWSVALGQATDQLLLVEEGVSGTKYTDPAPLFGGEPTLPGKLYYVDQAAALTTGLYLGKNIVPQYPAFRGPLAILPPKYSAVLQILTAAVNQNAGFVWDAISPREEKGAIELELEGD